MNLQKLNFGKMTLMAAVVGWFVVLVTIFQNCAFIKREPLAGQSETVTAPAPGNLTN